MADPGICHLLYTSWWLLHHFLLAALIWKRKTTSFHYKFCVTFIYLFIYLFICLFVCLFVCLKSPPQTLNQQSDCVSSNNLTSLLTMLMLNAILDWALVATLTSCYVMLRYMHHATWALRCYINYANIYK